MDVSLPGLAVVAVLLAVSACFGPPLVVATIAAFAFGATAIGSLDALGGASPLIYVVPGSALIAVLALRRRTLREVEAVLMRDLCGRAVVLVMVYAIASAAIMPRLFEGATTAFVVVRAVGVSEVPLAPGAGNVSQTAYFVFGGLTYAAFSVILLRPASTVPVARGFFLWAFLTAAFGAIDRLGKLVGAGDVLEPIRTASYAMLTDSDLAVGSVTRISGAFSEASAFGSAALAAFAFTGAYWRRTGSYGALALGAALLALVLLSTSSTAYGGVAVLAVLQLAGLARAAVTGRLLPRDHTVVGMLCLGGIALLACYLVQPQIFDPVTELVRTTVIEKGESQSGRERGYWNTRNLEILGETAGLGVGMGSSRASSWVVAVLSQLGIVGAMLMAALLVSLLMPCPPVAPDRASTRIAGLHDGARLCALTILLTAAISAGQADPGAFFFIALATVLGCRSRLRAADARRPIRSAPDRGGARTAEPAPRPGRAEVAVPKGSDGVGMRPVPSPVRPGDRPAAGRLRLAAQPRC